MAASPRSINGTADSQLYTPPTGLTTSFGLLMGWSISGSAAGVMRLRETSASGQVIGELTLAGAGGATVWFGPQGVKFNGGLFEDWVSGTFAGVVYIG